MIHWLRHPKQQQTGEPIKPSTMQEVRATLIAIRGHGREIWESDVRVLVDRRGRVFFETEQQLWSGRQSALADVLDLFSEFAWSGPLRGPDLVRPRPTLRIIPGKLSGEPHIDGTRIATKKMAALVTDGIEPDEVLELYPDLTRRAVLEAIDLEKQLSANAA
jgi:uncharacterized protein (DUF433 family)